MRKGHELLGIEILRFVCAFGVIMSHYHHFFMTGAWDPDVSTALHPALPWYWALRILYEHGASAVPFFWAISGFIFYMQYSEQLGRGAVQFSDFLIRRFSRLYPLHLVTLVLVTVGQYVYARSHASTFIYTDAPAAFASQLLFASNWFASQPFSFNGPIWSVSIEILIYLVFFAVARACGPKAWVAAAACVMFAILFRLGHGFFSPDVFACGMYFFAGGLVHTLARRPFALQLLGCIALACPVVLIVVPHERSAVLLPAAMIAVATMVRFSESGLLLPFRRLAFLGNATYSSYLIHFPLQLLLVISVDALGLKRDLFYNPAALLGFMGTVLTLSLYVHRYLEMPAQEYIRHRIRFSTPGSVATAVQNGRQPT
jgi:peptidoglycan/LPS O-acetylase OafA/YrhL